MSLHVDKSTWTRVAFGDVIDSVTDRVDNPTDAGVERYVGLEHLDPGVLIVQRWDSPDKVEAQKLRFRPGDVIFGRRRAYQKKVARADFEGICSAHALVLRARPGRIDPDFLPVFVSSDYFLDRAISISVGSLSPTVNWGDLKAEEFLLPPLPEQKSIADLLWAVERHRRSAGTRGQTLKAVTRIRFAERVGEGVLRTAWPILPTHRLVTSGPTNGKSAPATEDTGGIPTLSISAVRDGRVRGGSSIKYLSLDGKSVESFVLQRDDFLVVRGNGNKGLTGLGGLVGDGLPEGCIYPDLLIRIRFDRVQILPEFAAALWNSTEAHDRLLTKAKSTNGIWKINGKDIKSHELVVPPKRIQEEIMGEMADLRDAIAETQRESEALSALKSTLLADIFGGL